jgi:hypothetical protein
MHPGKGRLSLALLDADIDIANCPQSNENGKQATEEG